MEIYGKPMEHLWENDGFGTQNPLAAIGIPCVFHVFPQVPTCYPLPIISILIILIACDWLISHTYMSVGINPYVYHNWKAN